MLQASYMISLAEHFSDGRLSEDGLYGASIFYPDTNP